MLPPSLLLKYVGREWVQVYRLVANKVVTCPVGGGKEMEPGLGQWVQ
jgi:hypothetical protein